ncbi:hypothetical protein C5167_045311 [Papaver somniferum]|uniref:peroxidase n=1 Tax=Papaver somniferum TaxID=3469 RepID=A0A4Y7LAG3_PAPSO|nr:hypothetical protein C5167_045311 [Papaver somniferum]
MAYSSSSSSWPFFFFLLVSSLCMFGMNISTTTAQLSPSFYSSSCPNVLFTIQNAVLTAISNEPRMGASLLRLHFHDCFGCDASILLDDTSSFTGEKTAFPNANSVRGYDIIDTIKAQVEALCPKIVSCADILAVAARDSVAALGGRPWIVQLGRRDAKTASKNDANTNLPPATLSLSGLITSFSNKGFTTKEMVILSGSHSIGQARCTTFRSRIHNETNIDAPFATLRKTSCPTSGNDNNLAPLDATPLLFDNTYYKNLVSKKGLLHSDQELFNGGSTDAQVTAYSNDNPTFLTDFAVAMVKMGNLSPLTVSSLCMFGMNISITSAQLSSTFYATSCPNLLPTIQAAVVNAVSNEARMGASLLRLHFHDCFGCDASILLDDTSSFTGEKTAGPNANSVRGFNVIDTIKTQVEAICPKTVSCADILAVAARDSVAALGGRPWVVQLGRRDAKTASMSDANSNLPAATLGLSGLIASFSTKGFTTKEMVILSGSHSIGQARCTTFRSRIHNETNIDAPFATSLKTSCPTSGNDNNLSPLDATPIIFDNTYYKNLVSKKGLLHSDQELFNSGSTDAQVTTYSNDNPTFLTDFAVAMVKMGNLSPLTGSNGEIRTNCRKLN